MSALAKVPCTIVTGFLGAGKTTLVRHVLENAGGRRLAVIVNEFGDVGIDGDILKGVIAVVDGAAVAAGRFADDPEAIARQRADDSSLDHDNPLEEVFEDQLLCADLVILNKADLISKDERRTVTDEIGRTLPRAVKVFEAENGKVPVEVLLGLGARAEADLDSRPSHHDLEGEHDHEDFDTFIVDLPAFDSPQQVVDRLAKAAEAHDILRLKGFVDIAGKPLRLLVQGVGSRIQHQFDRKWPTGGRRGRLVVIGEKGFDRDAIRALIAS